MSRTIPEMTSSPNYALTTGLPRVVTEPLHFTPDDIRRLPGGVGVVLHLMDAAGALLMADHKATKKHSRRAWGPVSETLRWSSEAVEKPLHAVARCLQEELEIDEPNELGLQTAGPLTLSWTERSRRILTVTYSLYVPEDAKDLLLAPKRFDNTEIFSAQFMPEKKARELHAPRIGTHAWLLHLGKLGLAGVPPTDGELVVFPSLSEGGSLGDTDILHGPLIAQSSIVEQPVSQ